MRRKNAGFSEVSIEHNPVSPERGVKMTKYKITAVVESDDEYSDGNQIEELKDDISMLIADYNCFCEIGSVKIEELN